MNIIFTQSVKEGFFLINRGRLSFGADFHLKWWTEGKHGKFMDDII